ncbi:SIMPL domain-containing protein [Solibacillus sp. FSL H8-0538]|uniref:SIMPL domain-containing protein n=1 Tax=Solibacillus sp. FSL H8-0538 TaxID=2921400 RepID=UPI0030FAFD5A
MYFPNVIQQASCSSRVVTVTGNGKIAVRPNYAQLQIEVSTKGKEVSEAQQENANIMNQVIQSIIALSIPREAIQTAVYNIFPNYDYIDGKQVFRGYEVKNAITVKITDMNKIGTVIDTAVLNGANHVSAMQFRIENADIYYQQALNLALQNAQMKARTIADTMHLILNPQPLEIIEESNAEPVMYRALDLASISTPIEQGQIVINAAVRVKFQY